MLISFFVQGLNVGVKYHLQWKYYNYTPDYFN